MRILHLLQRPQFRGVEIFTTQLADELERSGWTVRMLALFPPRGRPLFFKGEKIPHLGADPGKRIFDTTAWREIDRTIREFKPDIVQANAADTLKYAVFSKRFFGWKARLVYRNASMLSEYLKNYLHEKYNILLLKQTDAIACVSHNTLLDLLQLGIPQEMLYYNPVGTPLPNQNQYDRPAARELLSRFASFPADERIVFHVGAFQPEKNHKALFRIFEQLLQKGFKAHMFLFGEGPLKSRFQNQVATTPYHDRIHFMGAVDNLAEYWAGADLLVLPSRVEGLPGVVLEAMANRVPVVASRVGGIPEVIIDGETGRLADPQDIGTFTEAVLDLWNKPGKQDQQLAKAFHKVRCEYSLEVVARRFVALYDRLLDSHAQT